MMPVRDPAPPSATRGRNPPSRRNGPASNGSQDGGGNLAHQHGKEGRAPGTANREAPGPAAPKLPRGGGPTARLPPEHRSTLLRQVSRASRGLVNVFGYSVDPLKSASRVPHQKEEPHGKVGSAGYQAAGNSGRTATTDGIGHPRCAGVLFPLSTVTVPRGQAPPNSCKRSQRQLALLRSQNSPMRVPESRRVRLAPLLLLLLVVTAANIEK